MVKRNPNIAKLNAGYLFPEIAKRKRAFLEKNPSAQLISLGIGDTTEPIAPYISNGMKQKAEALMTREGYEGYGPEQGHLKFREKIASTLYHNKLDADEIFISDGSKCDIGRLQLLFGDQVTIAVQDPTYPVYVDSGVILGQTSDYNKEAQHYNGIVYMKCLPSNHFFPDLTQVPRTDLIYFCSPNNPTGATATKEQLTALVKFAKKNRSIIIFDAAYSSYIQDPSLPRSIYEIEGAHEVAIELGSFSKMAGFTGIRLAWSTIPKKLNYDEGHSVHVDWNRINSTFFNGASNISQAGGLAALQPEGLEAMSKMVNFYMENTKILKLTFEDLGYSVYGGSNAPYLWVKFNEMTSWHAFEDLMTRANIICTPGSGFGPGGEGFLRFSAFGNRSTIEEAAKRIRTLKK